jgi:hypothetical protein
MGVDAQQTAEYRRYPMEESMIYRRLREMYGCITREILHSLIEEVVSRYPTWARPQMPTGPSRRAKYRLVEWIDDHEALVLAHFRRSSGAVLAAHPRTPPLGEGISLSEK